MPVNWRNPYDGVERFNFKGNLHTHTPNPRSKCGSVPMDELVSIYKKLGFSFMAVTNHDIVTDVSAASSESFAVIPGIEIDVEGRSHFGVVNSDAKAIFYDPSATQQEMIDRNVAAGALATLHHPDWQIREHYTIDELAALKGYDGIEIYNYVIEELEGSPLSTAKWDRLLSTGRRVLGFANQDFHNYPHAVDCCNAVAAKRLCAEDILDALKSGRFYAHKGVRIERLGRDGDEIFVETGNAKLIRFIGFGGVVLMKAKGSSARIRFDKGNGRHAYIRVECLGEGEDISFSQPFFRD